MKTQIILNKRFSLFIIILFILFPATSLLAWEAGDIEVTNVSALVLGDSLNIRFSLRVNNLKIGSQESLTLQPSIAGDKTALFFPEIIYCGGQRKIYNERRWNFSHETRPAIYHIYTPVRQGVEYAMEYESSVPYLSRTSADNLHIEALYENCCDTFPLNVEHYTFAFTALQPPVAEKLVVVHDTIYIREAVAAPPVIAAVPEKVVIRDTVRIEKIVETPPPPPAPKKYRKETLYLEYPVNEYTVLTDYNRNQNELSRLDALLEGYKGEIRVTAYASPDGPYDKNEKLAHNRAQGFRTYLAEHHGIPLPKISATFVAEDWDGLRKKLEDNNFDDKAAVLDIIDHVGNFAGREKQLLLLRGGSVWQRMKPFFKQLRRIELELLDVLEDN